MKIYLNLVTVSLIKMSVCFARLVFLPWTRK